MSLEESKKAIEEHRPKKRGPVYQINIRQVDEYFTVSCYTSLELMVEKVTSTFEEARAIALSWLQAQS